MATDWDQVWPASLAGGGHMLFAGSLCVLVGRRGKRRRPQQYRCKQACGHHRAIPGSPWRYAVFHRVPLWLGLEGAGRPQQHRCSLHHSSRATDPLQRRLCQRIAVRRENITAGRAVGCEQSWQHQHHKQQASSRCSRHAPAGHLAQCLFAAGRGCHGGLDVACQRHIDRAIFLKRKFE
ncbi:hypothetical protein D3C78_1212150 [compost metagenome]